MATQDAFYRPYASESESDTDTDSDSDSSLSTDTSSSSYASQVGATGGPNFRSLAQGLTLGGLAGPSFDSSGSQLDSQNLPLGFAVSSGYPTFKNYEVTPDPSGGALKASSQNVTSIIMLDSRDRDRNVYPQPTNLTLRLPRIYSNVTAFQVVQMKLLSAFLYFRNDKNNTDISILELGRQILNQNGQLVDNIIKTFMRPGSYDINGLLSELTTQLNFTPVFYDYPNGFQDFAPRFAATGDFSLNFNFPGDTYYDSLLDTFIANPTMSLIISKYFQNQYAGLSSYTTDQIKVAYYYPVVKETLLDEDYVRLMNLSITTSTAFLLPGETVRSRCIYTFQGLNDPVILEVINLNLNLLNDYRVKHTFRYSFANKYNVSFETQTNRVTIASPSLNTSLVNLLNYKQAQYLAEQLSQNGLTSDEYNALQTQNTILLAVLNDIFYFIQRWLAFYYGVQFNQFSLDYVANPDYLIPIRDAYNATGISSNFDANVIARNVPPESNDILTPLRQPAPKYWNRMTDLSESSFAFPFNLETGNSNTSSNYPYSILLDQQDRSYKFVDSNDHLYTNQLTRYADIVVPLNASKYTTFKFKSPVRQTLQVETLPRPLKYRYPAYNQVAYDLSHQTIFDNSYSFVQGLFNDRLDVNPTFAATQITYIPGFSTIQSTNNFGINYASSIQLWSTKTALAQVGSTRSFFQFQTPLPPDTSAQAYRYPLSLTMAPANGLSTFVTPMNMYLYHDRAAFMADVSANSLEKTIHYLTTMSTTTTMSTATMTFPVYGNQTYYLLARSQETTIPTQTYRIAPWFPDGSNYTALASTLTGFNPLADPSTPAALSNYNYAKVADPGYIRLPIQSTIQNNPYTDPVFTPLTFSTFAIGYDASGVSTDLTDYVGYIQAQPNSNAVPNTSLRVDPINGYTFQVASAYNSNTQNYLYSNSGNAVLQPNGAGLYTPKPVASRETVAVHWYGNTYLANSENQPPMESNTISDSNAITPYTGATTGSAVQGYTYGGSNGAIQFGDGVCGFGIVPQQGLWDIQRVMFKSIYTSGDSNSDENLKIKYLGIFPAALTSNTYIHDFTLDSALAVMKFNRATTYSSTLTLGFDAAGGTYYEFIRDSNYNTGTPSYLCGYSQIRGTLNTDLNSAYTCIPFDVNGNFLFYQGLVGSPVPYPYYSDASAALTYLDGTAAPLAKGVVVPRLKTTPDPVRGPPTGYDQTQSKYELSMPIGTNLLNYVAPYPYTQIATPMYPFDPLPYSPSLVVADVSGYIMTQDSYYRVFEYSADTSNYSMVEKYQFTLDQIYPPVDPLINFIGVAANEQEYAFFAYSNEPVPTPGTSKILIRTMRPSDGAVTDTLEIANLVDFDPTVQQITNITYNNYGGFTLGLKQGTTVSAICKHNATTSTMTTFSNADPVLFNANLDRLLTRQSPKESDGLFYVFPYRTGLAGGITEGITDYIKVDPTITDVAHNPFYKYTANTGPQDVWANNTPVVLQVFNLSNATAPQIFRQPIITRQPFKDYVSLLSETDPQRFYQVLSFTTSNTTNVTSNAFTQTSVYQFPSVTSNFTQGANGARWSLIGNTLYGNRNDTVDAPRKVFSAWQLFYPLQRVTMRLVAKNFTFIHDLSGLIYPEYPHTAIAGYDSSGSITADTSRRWGLEASGNFVVADFGFSGVTFNSYVFTFPLKPNTVSKPYYYLTVRNYTPTEKSQVLMRFSLNNKYDFGYVSMADISNEIVYSLTNSNQFTPDYYAGLQAFNSNFVIGSNGRIFGANVVQGYPGSNLSNVTGFGDFYGRFVNIYNQYNEQVQLVQRINAAVKSNVENFIRTELVNILPASSLNRQRFTDPLTFKILWRSALFPQYAKLEENWGLGWNLGFAKADTPYETVHRADSFFKILDDFISLRLNPEYDMNRMDTSAKENLAATKEPTGATKAFHGKLMLANFGSFAQTIISNPVSFYPPLGRMDKLTFQWVDVTGAVINNDNCEWNAVVQIVEKKDMTEISNPPLINPTTRAGTA